MIEPDPITADEWVRLIRRVFAPRDEDRALAVLVDLPDARVPDNPAWARRRRMVQQWSVGLREAAAELGMNRISVVLFRNAGRNNAELPEVGCLQEADAWPQTAEQLAAEQPLAPLLAAHPIVLAVTEFSATAPLKLLAPRLGLRAATMPGFSPGMIPALKLDWERVDRRCRALKRRLDPAESAEAVFDVEAQSSRLRLDLRHRVAVASGGLITRPGTAGNLPSGETYIVPYEGERAGDPSRTAGMLPLELDGELMLYRVDANRVVELMGDGPRARSEREELAAEPAYANVAELGLGVLAELGVRPVGELLLDEKLGLHIAFGRSDHFGGAVGVADFSRPDRVVHIDRVYIPEVQPRVRVRAVDLIGPDGSRQPLIRDDRYVEHVFDE